MLYQPKTVWEMWDTWLVQNRGTHYLFSIHRSKVGRWHGITLATSRDGVHYEEIGSVIEKRDDADWLGSGSVWKAGGSWLMNFSESRAGVQSVFFARSDDLVHWERMGDEYRSDPDPRWYDTSPAGRWDSIWVVPVASGGYLGYLTARPLPRAPGLSFESAGRVASDDGVHWSAAPPPAIDWGDWPAMNVGEVGAIERIDDRYYLIVGCYDGGLGRRQVARPLAYPNGMHTFVADDPAGPFRPDAKRFTLFTSNVAYYARFYPTSDGMLVNHHHYEKFGDGPHVWMAPLKRAVVDGEGHLSLGYWQGNERLKGEEVPLDLTRHRLLFPPEGLVSSRVVARRLELKEPARGGLVVLERSFDLERGLVLEVTLSVREPSRRWSGIGFYIEHGLSDHGTAIMLQTRGSTEVASVDAGGGLTVRERFEGGIEADRASRCRLLLRRAMLEIYLEDRFVASHGLPELPTGRIGFAFESGTAVYRDPQAWAMDLQ